MAGQGRRNRSALVLYGSETGTAQDFAGELGSIIERLRFQTHVSSLNTIEPRSLSEYSILVISISTAGQGDLPYNARQFWKSLLRRKLPPDYLQDVQFTTFGLGDSSYPKFNWAARKLHKRLIQLGAHELYPCGEGDEQHPDGLDGSFVPWSTDLRRHLLHTFPLDQGINPIPENEFLIPKWSLALLEESTNKSDHPVTNGNHHSVKRQPENLSEDPQKGKTLITNGNVAENTTCELDNRLNVSLQENRRLTHPGHWQDVRHLVFQSNLPSVYEPGDVLTIYPKNFPEDVDNFIDMMDWKAVADKPLNFVWTGSDSAADSKSNLPIAIRPEYRRLTLRELLTSYLDLTAVPRRSFFALIAHFTQDQYHKDRLLEFTKPEYIDELYDYTTRPRRSIPEVLQEFASVRIAWQWAASVLPELRGRQFSIASGGQLKRTADGKSSFDLLVAIVKYKTVIKKIRQGVCTRYLAAMSPGAEMLVTLQKGGLGITRAEARKPVVLIGPGTGVAPMRSLIWERLQWAEEFEAQAGKRENRVGNGNGTYINTNTIGQTILFFGCRNLSSDYFYRQDWAHLKTKMPLQVFTAFSRDQSQKIYVQDILKQQADLVFRLLHDSGGIVYVCGSSGKMPQAVRAAITEVLKTCGGMPLATAEEYLKAMEREGRYRQETW